MAKGRRSDQNGSSANLGFEAKLWLHWFTSALFQELLRARAMLGASVDRTSLLEFPKYPVLLPRKRAIDRFEELVRPMWAMIHTNQDQMRTCADLRDTLLPKLLSAELTVADWERTFARVA